MEILSCILIIKIITFTISLHLLKYKEDALKSDFFFLPSRRRTTKAIKTFLNLIFFYNSIYVGG